MQMASTNFIDYVKLYLKAGKGGAGLVHFMRAKFVPKGGPDGGDGGRGGHIFLRGDKQRSTLLHLKYRKHIRAPNGDPGGDALKTGASGADVVLDVPLGTVAKRADGTEILVEVLEHKKKYSLMQGGKGGWGNARFKSPTQQAPRVAYPGEPGMEDWMVLELKLLADVGLVGLPNAGKSTLISVVSAARPRIDSYPFTTLTPNLGVVPYREGHSFVVADLPGIVEGAAAGKGLGTRFLRHIERNSVLVLLVSAETTDVAQSYALLLRELVAHNPLLLEKPHLLVVSKIDLLDQAGREALMETMPKGVAHRCISAHTTEGIEPLKDALWHMLQRNETPAAG